MKTVKKCTFTLIELLVMISIIAILAGMRGDGFIKEIQIAFWYFYLLYQCQLCGY